MRLALPDAASAWDDGFATAVGQRYGAEIARIKRLLRGVWGFLWVTDGMVEEILTILQSMDFEAAVALLSGAPSGADGAAAVGSDERAKLLDELGDTHRRRFREQVLALYQALPAATLSQADRGLLAGMDLAHLRPQEHASLRRALRLLPEAERQALRDDADPERGRAVAVILDEASSWDAAAERTRTAERITRQQTERTAALDLFAGDAALGAVFADIRQTLAAGPRDRERLEMLDRLEPWMREPEKLRAVALRLQADEEEGDLFEAWLDGFPVERLYQAPEGTDAAASGEHRLAVLLRLLEFRDPWRNAQLARELATQTWFLDIVNDEEAWLALQLITVLPPALQDRLLEDLRPRIDENLSLSQRESLHTNFYRGGEGGRDLASIQSQLLDDGLWTMERVAELAGLLRMAIAARQHEWVFNLSRRHQEARPEAYADAEFQRRIVQPYQLYDPEARPAYRPEFLESVSTGAEVFEFFTNIPIVSGILRGLAVLIDAFRAYQAVGEIDISDGLAVLEARGIDITRLQGLDHLLRALGYTFYGVRFADRAELPLDGTTADAAASINFIDRMRYREGIFEMEAAALRIAAIRTPLGSTVIQGGAGTLDGLTLRVSTGVAAPSMAVSVRSLTLTDLLVVQPGSMKALNRIEIDALDIRVGEDAVSTWLGTALFSAAALSRGPESETSSLTEPDAPTPMELRFDAVRLMGLVTSGGQVVDTLTLEGGTIGVSGSRAGYLRHLQASGAALTERIGELSAQLQLAQEAEERTRLEGEIERVMRQREAVQALHRQIMDAQSRVAAVEARSARGEALTAEQRRQLETDRELLARFEHGGVVIDLERVHVTGVRGQLTMQDLELSDVHGAGTSSAALLGLVMGSDMLPRILQGERFEPDVLGSPGDTRPSATAPHRHRTDFELDLGTLNVRGLRLLDAVPTPEEADRDLEDAREALDERPWDRALAQLVAEEETRSRQAREYARLAAMGLSTLNAEETATMRELYESLSSRETLFAHHLHTEGTVLTLSDSGRELLLGADRLDLTGAEDGSAGLRLRSGVRRLSIGAMHGTNVRAGGALAGGLLALPEDSASMVERLRRIGLSGDSLSVLEFDEATSGLHFDSALLADFNLALDNEAAVTTGEGDAARTHHGTLDAVASLARVEGLRSDVTLTMLQERVAELESKAPERRTPADLEHLAQAQEAVQIFSGFLTLIEALRERTSGAASASDRQESETALADTLLMFKRWRRQLGVRSAEVHDLSVQVAGLGAVTAPDFDLDRALESGVLIRGTGTSADGSRSDRIFREATVTGGRFGAHEAERVHAVEAAGSILVSDSRIEFRSMTLDRLELEGFYIEAGANQIWNSGTSTATGIAVSGSMEFDELAEHPGQRYLARVNIDRFDIATLQGGGLSFYYTDSEEEGPVQVMGEVESGVIGGIWASNLQIVLTESGAFSMAGSGNGVLRQAGIRSLDDVRVNGIDEVRVKGMLEGALQFGRARLNGSELKLTFLESGGQRIEIGDLSLDEGEFRTADGHIRIRAHHLAGTVVHEGTVWRLEGVTLPTLVLERLSWRSGSKTFSVEEPATLSGLRVDASIDTATKGNAAVHIDRLHADGLVGGHFRYEDPPLVVEVRQQAAWPGATNDAAAFARPAIEVGAIDIADLDWTQRGGLPTSGTVDVESVHAALRVLKDDLDVGALVDTGSLFVGFRRDGADVSAADIGVEASGTLADGVTMHSRVTGASTGLVRFYEDRIEANDLELGRIELMQFGFESADYRVSLPAGAGHAALESVTASVTVDLDPAAESLTPTRIVIHHVTVPTATVAGLEVVLKHFDVGGTPRDITLRLPASPEARLTDLGLGPAPPAIGFILTPSFVGPPATGEVEWLAEGALGIGTLDVEQFGVEVQGLLNATSDVHVEGITLGLLSSGDRTLDVRQIDLTQLRLAAAEHHIEVLGLPPHVADDVPGGQAGVSLTGLTRSGSGDWGLEAASVAGLVYRNPALGLTLEIASAQLPLGFSMPQGGAFSLHELQIDDAWFRIDDLSALTSDAPGMSREPGIGVGNWNFLDALHGTVNFDVDIDWHPDLEIRLDIHDGVISYAELEDQLSLEDAFLDFDYDDNGTLVLNFDWGNLVFASLFPGANASLVTLSDMGAADRQRAEEGRVRLSLLGNEVQRMLREDAGEAESTDDTEAAEAAEGESTEETEDSSLADTVSEWVRIRNVMVDLGLRPTDIQLVKGETEIGTLVLGGGGHDGVEGLSVRGNIPSQLQLAIERIGVSTRPGSPLNFDGTSVGLGSVVVEGVRDVTIDFSGFTPGAMEGRIDAARAQDIVVE